MAESRSRIIIRREGFWSADLLFILTILEARVETHCRFHFSSSACRSVLELVVWHTLSASDQNCPSWLSAGTVVSSYSHRRLPATRIYEAFVVSKAKWKSTTRRTKMERADSVGVIWTAAPFLGAWGSTESGKSQSSLRRTDQLLPDPP